MPIRWIVSSLCVLALGLTIAPETHAEDSATLRVGIIGLDTSHAVAFAKTFNADPADPEMRGCRVVAAYPQGSPDIESSASRIPQYTAQFRDDMGIEICDSIKELLSKVDRVCLETNDGRLHVKQAQEVIDAGVPLFVDKPAGANLADVVALYAVAKEAAVPMFSSSSLRFSSGPQAIRSGKYGDVLGCNAYSPCSLESTHSLLYWYGIHGVELLYTCMGTGCQSVSHTSTEDFELSVGRWSDGRIGVFRGMRKGKRGYGGTAFTEEKNLPIGGYEGYRPLVVEIAKFFRTGEPPVPSAETIELYAFMSAAAESKRQDGQPVTIKSVMKKAEADAKKK